jgi:hypothetical protein
MTGKAEEILERGSELLETLLAPHGFAFRVIGAGNSSGGDFAYGEFRKHNRSLELHLRHTLGKVSYHLTDHEMSHENYMRSVLGRHHSSHYPGFSDDPFDGFRHLRLDLEKHGSEFLAGTDECLMSRIEKANSLPPARSGVPD